MTKQELIKNIKKKRSLLCVGLDTDINRIPPHLLKEEYPIFEFNKQIIDSTQEYVIAYKPNIAFYESKGIKGWLSLKKTIEYINFNYPEIFTIADAKRGDIGNTSKMYAEAFFKELNFNSITVAPYMGEDSISPFLEYRNKWAIILALTSNKGAEDFQFQKLEGEEFYKKVLEKTSKYGTDENIMYVVGATREEHFKEVRKLIPNHFLLVPGVGAQGGKLEEVCKNGLNTNYGLIINSSRGIIYADNTKNFADIAKEKAKEIQKKIEVFL